MGPNKILGLYKMFGSDKNFRSEKRLLDNNNMGQKKIKVNKKFYQKFFRSKEKIWVKKFWVKKKFVSKKNLGSKNIWVQKNFDPTFFLG